MLADECCQFVGVAVNEILGPGYQRGGNGVPALKVWGHWRRFRKEWGEIDLPRCRRDEGLLEEGKRVYGGCGPALKVKRGHDELERPASRSRQLTARRANAKLSIK